MQADETTNKEMVSVIRQFLTRVSLTGNEVAAYNAVQTWLDLFEEPKSEPKPIKK